MYNNLLIAMKIQCSEATYSLLDKLGGFKLECRGDIDIKASSDHSSNYYFLNTVNPTLVDNRVKAQ